MRSLWWLFLLGILVTGAAAYLMLSQVQNSRQNPRAGDGRDPTTYGFPLQPLAVPLEEIHATRLPKGAIEALDFPEVYDPDRIAAEAEKRRAKYLVSHDRVVGVVAGGRARAYPLSILDWHEVVNDTLGGVPIVVTYSPLSDGVAVFERRVGGEEPLFGVSGLLMDSNLIFFDRREDPDEESLWSQILAAPIAGPAVASDRSLVTIPAQLVHWQMWQAKYPETEVMGRDETRLQIYKRRPYSSYFGSDELRFPVSPLPATAELRLKAPVLVLEAGDSRRVLPLSTIEARADANGGWTTDVGSHSVRLFVEDRPPVVWVDELDAVDDMPDPETTLQWRQACWFAWYATSEGIVAELP